MVIGLAASERWRRLRSTTVPPFITLRACVVELKKLTMHN